MEGRTIVRPDRCSPACDEQERPPSMEGRTIVRPDSDRHIHPRLRRAPSMEGRTIVRPDSCKAGGYEIGVIPSMEGRTIVRPDWPGSRLSLSAGTTFNGGPDNRPARRALSASCPVSTMYLQWRAGQSSGQTSDLRRRLDTGLHPSMEGRTIVRPDLSVACAVSCTNPAFNGGPDNRPARRLNRGQIQHLAVWSFNGGPDNRPARPGKGGHQTVAGIVPSMEGRTIVRPDLYKQRGRLAKQDCLQWRAGQSSGQTQQFSG